MTSRHASSARGVIAIATALCALPARAGDPVDVFGFGPRGAATAGAFTARSDDASAAMYNPAGSSLMPDASLLFGYGGGVMNLRIDEQSAEVKNPHGVSIAAAFPFQLGPVGFGSSFALYLPDAYLARLYVRPLEQPRFLLLDNDPHRIVFNATIAIRPWPWLSIGGGITMLSDAAGNGVRFDLNAQGGQAQGDSALDIELPTRIAPVVGVLLLPAKDWRVGVAWRGAIDLSLRVDIVADIEFTDVVAGDVLISLRAFNLYTPHRLSVGVAYDWTAMTTTELDVTYYRWSDFRGDTFDLQTILDLNTAPSTLHIVQADQTFRDVIVPRLGVEHWRRHGVSYRSAWRAGALYEQSPVKDQTGLTSYADNDRIVLTAGAGLVLPAGRIFLKPMSIDLTLQYQHLIARHTRKDSVAGPTADFSSSGQMVHGSLAWTVRF